MPDDDSQDRHPAFSFPEGKEERGKPVEAAESAEKLELLIFHSRDMAGCNLPGAVAPHDGVRKLHHTIERLAFGCSFPVRLAEDNRSIVAVEPHFHVNFQRHHSALCRCPVR